LPDAVVAVGVAKGAGEDGQATEIGQYPNKGQRRFQPPDKGEMLDWVLVLDDASKKYPAPGARQVKPDVSASQGATEVR